MQNNTLVHIKAFINNYYIVRELQQNTIKTLNTRQNMWDIPRIYQTMTVVY